MVRPERAVIDCRSMLIDEQHVPAVPETPMLIADAEADVIRAVTAPGPVEMIRHRRDGQACCNDGEDKNEFFHLVVYVVSALVEMNAAIYGF